MTDFKSRLQELTPEEQVLVTRASIERVIDETLTILHYAEGSDEFNERIDNNAREWKHLRRIVEKLWSNARERVRLHQLRDELSRAINTTNNSKS